MQEKLGATAAAFFPYSRVARHGTPPDLKNFYILHEGVILAADGQLTEDQKGWSGSFLMIICASTSARTEV